MTLDPLLSATDFAKFQARDQDWFLGAVGDTIRDFCGWHIWPIISVLDQRARIGNKGIIMLPTLNLVSVEAVRIPGTAPWVVESVAYEPDPAGFLTMQTFGWRRARGSVVSVDFTHGYEEMPKAVAEVGFELTARTMEKPAGVVKHMTRGPTDMDFLEFGAVLSDDQKTRLGPYTITRV
jgi:hypothetical protein